MNATTDSIPRFVSVAQEGLARCPDMQIDVLTATSDGKNAIPITLLADEDGVIDDALFISAEAQVRPRLVAAYKLSARNTSMLVLFVEDQLISPLSYATPLADDSGQMAQAMTKCASDFAHLLRGSRRARFAIAVDDPSAATAIAARLTEAFEAAAEPERP